MPDETARRPPANHAGQNGASIRQVYSAISKLLEEQLIVFLLRDFEGLTTEETAGVMGTSEDAIKGRLKRARQAIHEELAGRR